MFIIFISKKERICKKEKFWRIFIRVKNYFIVKIVRIRYNFHAYVDYYYFKWIIKVNLKPFRFTSFYEISYLATREGL